MNLSFNEVLEVIDNLAYEEKEILMEILKNRQIQYRRKELLNDIKVGKKDFKNKKTISGNSFELMSEILK